MVKYNYCIRHGHCGNKQNLQRRHLLPESYNRPELIFLSNADFIIFPLYFFSCHLIFTYHTLCQMKMYVRRSWVTKTGGWESLFGRWIERTQKYSLHHVYNFNSHQIVLTIWMTEHYSEWVGMVSLDF